MEGREGAVLSQAAAKEMLTPQVDLEIGGWGLGVQIDDTADDGLFFGHGGSNEGFHAGWGAYVDGHGGAAVMTNAEGGSELIGEIFAAISLAYDWDIKRPEERSVVELKSGEMEAISGRYSADVGEEEPVALTIEFADGVLWMDAPPFVVRERLFTETNSQMFLGRGWEIRVERDGEGKPTALDFPSYGVKAVRVGGSD
jgi:hypothetical protein